MLRSQHRVYDGSGEVARTQDVWGAEGISSRVKFLPLAWAGMPKTSFRKNSDSPNPLVKFQFVIDNIFDKTYAEHLNRSAASAAGPAIRKLVEPGRAYWGRITIDFDYPASFIN